METKQIDWNKDNLNRLWDYRAKCPTKEESYFCYQVGDAIVHFSNFFVDNIKKKKVLDYGSGMGHLIGVF